MEKNEMKNETNKVKLPDGREVALDALIAQLHNLTMSVGMGMLHDVFRDITREEAQKAIVWDRGYMRVDYLYGRPIKLGVKDGLVTSDSPLLYERTAGEGAFMRAAEAALVMP